MARVKLRQKAIELRQKGKTYSEIRRELKVPKSTLSDWLRKYPLTSEQIILLEKTRKKNKYLAIEKIRIAKQKKRDARILAAYEENKKKFLPLTERELVLAGMFLYWGEGQKRLNGPIGINNTDPKVVKFSLYWLTNSLKISKERIRVYLHLYKDMDIDSEIKFWSNELKIPLSQFSKPYIKESTRKGLTHKGFGHGTCALVIGNVLLKEKIMMTIEALADFYCSKI